ncbi:transmembrane protein, partial [Cystoisospora suis]
SVFKKEEEEDQWGSSIVQALEKSTELLVYIHRLEEAWSFIELHARELSEIFPHHTFLQDLSFSSSSSSPRLHPEVMERRRTRGRGHGHPSSSSSPS